MHELHRGGSECHPPTRLDYFAVPLDAWDAYYPGTNQGYLLSSTAHIAQKLDRAFTAALDNGWVQSPELAPILRRFMEESLVDTHAFRAHRNGAIRNKERELVRLPIDEIVVGYDERVERAKQGLSVPLELFDILADYPAFGSIELAKLSHPLDFTATAAMDNDIAALVAARDGDIMDGNQRFKMKRLDEEIPAAIVARKRTVANVLTASGLIEIIERKHLLVRGDREASGEDGFLCRKVKNPERFPELCDKMDGYLEHIRELPYYKTTWLQPMTTSYYARFSDSSSANA